MGRATIRAPARSRLRPIERNAFALTETIVRAGADRWADAATWSGGGIRRDAWFFESNGERLLASLYIPLGSRVANGFVVCPSWGWEFVQQHELCHGLALELARAGVAGLVYHPPGHGDSTGDPERATVDVLLDAAVDASASATDRLPDASLRFAGVRLGAALAVLAASRRTTDGLLLIQPALDPARFFEEMAAAGRRGRMRREAAEGDAFDRMVFGHPLADGLVLSARGRDATGSLASFDGTAVAVRYAHPGPDPLPAKVATVTVPGAWRPVMRDPDRADLVAGTIAAARRAGLG